MESPPKQRLEDATPRRTAARPIICWAHPQRLLDWLLIAFAGWTLSYHLVLWSRWPAYWLGVLWLPACGLVAACWLGLRRRAGETGPENREPAWAWWAVAAIGLVVATYVLVINRHDSDDIAYFRRALVQADNLGQPILISNVTYDVPVPDVVPTQYLVSYEMLPAFAGRLASQDALSLYFNVLAAVAALVCPLIYYLLFRQLDLSARLSVWAVVGAMVFLLVDGNRHWSPGNFAFVRIWQGKCILVTLGIPWIVLLSYRFLRGGRAADWFAVLLSVICAVGLSATGLVLAPCALLVLGVAFLVAGGELADQPWRARLARVLFLWAAVAYPASQAFLFRAWFPQAKGLIALASWQIRWWDIFWAFGDTRTYLFYAALLLAVPRMALDGRHARVIGLLAPTNALLLFNPVAGIWLMAAFSTIYFRVFYLFPLPLCAGLAVVWALRMPGARVLAAAAATAALILARLGWSRLPLATGSPLTAPLAVAVVGALVALLLWSRARRAGRPGAAVQSGAAAVLMGLALIQARQFTFSATNHPFDVDDPLETKSPLEYRFSRAVREFVALAAPRVHGRTLLAPWQAAVGLALTSPSARLVITRSGYSIWSFNAGGLQEQFPARELAQELVTEPTDSPEAAAAFRQLLAAGVDAVVVSPEADIGPLRAAFGDSGQPWQCAAEAGGYRLFVRSAAGGPRETAMHVGGRNNKTTTKAFRR